MNFSFQWANYYIQNSTTEVINETKEIHNWNGVSVALHVFLPVAGLAILWGRRDIFTRLLLQIDRSCVSIFCPSLSRREKLLQWASTRLPKTWSSQSRTLSGGIIELWKDGSLLCTLINTAIPGACPNPHRHWKKPPSHAQAIAYKYLGVVPVFTESDFKGSFTVKQERNLINYLQELNQSINTLPAKDDLEKVFTSQYVARGMGLFTGEQYRKTIFYLYSNSNSKIHSNILIHIRGPYGTYGKAIVPPFSNTFAVPEVKITREEEHKLNSFEPRRRKSFFSTISIDLSTFSNKKVIEEDIPILVEMEKDRAKVSYIPRNHGMYEINMICDGELLRGSPFSVHITQNTSNIKDSFESKSNISEDRTTFKRKIISKIIDFIDEKTVILPRRLSRAFAFDGFNSQIINNLKDDKSNETHQESDCEIDLEQNNVDFKNHDEKITNLANNEPLNLEITRNTFCHKISEEDEGVPDNKRNDLDGTNNTNSSDSEIKSNPNIEIPQNQFCQNPVNDPKVVESNSDFVASENIKNLSYINLAPKPEKIKKELHCEREDLKTNNLINRSTTGNNNNTTEEKNNLNNIHKTLNVKAIESKKYIKNIVNRSNKQETNRIVNNIQVTSQHLGEKPLGANKFEKFHLVQENSPLTHGTQVDLVVASPICPDHIAPEVNSYKQLSTKARRKIFARQSSISSSNSSFSENENVVVSQTPIKQTEHDLNITRVLGSIKTNINNQTYSISDRDENSYSSLSSTQSLPFISSQDSSSLKNWNSLDYEIDGFRGFVKEKRDYWNRLSSSNSINDYRSYENLGKGKLLRNNCQSLNKIYTASPNLDENIVNNDSMSKSFNDISYTKGTSNSSNSLKKCFSACDDKAEFSLLSIEERKKLLLKDNYTKESAAGRRHRFVVTKLKDKIENNVEKEKKTKTVRQRVSSSISNVIRKFDKKSFPETEVSKSVEVTNRLQGSKPNLKQPEPSKSMKESLKSKFKKTVNYFKQLEQNSSNKNPQSPKKNNNHQPPARRYSADVLMKRRQKESRLGGSLRISEKFSIFNLYDDVMGSKKGSFKGVPNQNGASHSLGSLKNKTESVSSNNLNDKVCEDDEIKFHFFINKSKKKVRKSIKSLFETNY